MNPQIKNPNRIFCGQIITIGFTGTATGANNAQVKQDMNAVYDTVQKGDSLSRIAYRNKLPLKQLVQMNPEVAKQKYIYIGQKVRIKLSVRNHHFWLLHPELRFLFISKRKWVQASLAVKDLSCRRYRAQELFSWKLMVL